MAAEPLLQPTASPPRPRGLPGVPGRTGWLVAGAAAFVLVLAAVLFFALSPRQAVLFADLRDRDLATMGEELRKKKIPFEVGDDGRSLLVPQADVHRIRMQLMAQDLALQGNVGFELFNGSDLGMTEFVQKVNYQRALQGELARTIQAMDEVQSARVHLALPEQGLFRKSQARSKASVTVTLKPGAQFSRAQVSGVQRLVAASVPEIVPSDVAVLDQRGVVLGSSGAGEDALDDGWTERKRSAEAYLAAKAAQVLDRMFGEGASLVSVDVQLSEERRSATIEEVLPGRPAGRDQAPAGVLVRERQVSRGGAAREAAADAAAGAAESSSFEYDYQVGRKVEQVQTPAGGVRRIGVAVVLKAVLSEQDAARVKEVVAAALGVNPQRGDTVAVTTLQRAVEAVAPGLPPHGRGLPAAEAVSSGVLPGVARHEAAQGPMQGPVQGPGAAPVQESSPAAGQEDGPGARAEQDRRLAWWLAATLGTCLAGWLGLAGRAWWRRRGRQDALDDRSREAVLLSVRGWLEAGRPTAGAGEGRS
jgi:flagellar M-ring protein FliF